LTPRDALRIIWKRKWLLILPLILTTLAAWGGSQLLRPVYRSSVIISVGNPVIMSRDLQQLTGFSGNYMGIGGQDRGSELRSLRNEITSTGFLSKLIFRMNLDSDPALEARVAKLVGKHPEWSPQAVKMDILTNNLKNRISLDIIASNQIKISAYSSDRQKAKDLAENLGNIFMSEKKEQMMRMVYSSIDFAYEQLEKYNKDLQDKIDEKNQLEEDLLKLQVEGSYGSDESRKQLNDEMQSTQKEIDNLKEEETEAKVEVSDLLLGNSRLKNDTLVTRKNGLLKDNYKSLAEKLKSVSWRDPVVISLKDKTYKLEQDIDAEIKYLVETQFKDATANQRNYLKQYFISGERMDILYAKLNNLKLAMADMNKNITLVPEYQSKLDQIDREIAAARQLRDQFKVQQEGYQISQKLLNQSRIDLIEEARVPLKPVSPDKNKLLVMGIMLGLALGGATILLVELFDNSVKQIGWVEDDLNLKVIGTIPRVSWANKAEKKAARK
jgi:succinoglycan biosynthesis transport protein ExoP